MSCCAGSVKQCFRRKRWAAVRRVHSLMAAWQYKMFITESRDGTKCPYGLPLIYVVPPLSISLLILSSSLRLPSLSIFSPPATRLDAEPAVWAAAARIQKWIFRAMLPVRTVVSEIIFSAYYLCCSRSHLQELKSALGRHKNSEEPK